MIPNKENIYILLIGMVNFSKSLKEDVKENHLLSIENIKPNLVELKKVFTDENLIGIDSYSIEIIEGEDNATNLLETIAEAKNKIPNGSTLIIYYAGHGIFSSKGKLFLTTEGSTVKNITTNGVNIDSFKDVIQEKSTKINQIIILDCCFSGALHGYQSDFSSDINVFLEKLKSINTYFLTATDKFSKAKYPSESADSPTYFTGKLIEIIKNGIDGFPEFLTWADLYEEIKQDFKKKNLPEPLQSFFGSGRTDYICKNMRYKPTNEENIAIKYFKDKDYDKAYPLLLDISKKQPNNLTVIKMLSTILFENYVSEGVNEKIEGNLTQALNAFNLRL
jgi:tetratricopeptide (TPR) repeat protein